MKKGKRHCLEQANALLPKVDWSTREGEQDNDPKPCPDRWEARRKC
jgi:hypothetical protein